ncbi:MAG: metalloregulator ArsR/SmtB family transcription factor [Oscillospiraceae bacterium]|jgi:DNA-binding transcriptional ArsR family regulator|nr:metalloregulator ArsR/SmtB family transcription factor [Oscillospiraceae bacterium]MDD3260386.1 metalloregulator ArsR/SmtB family transcription factor [Oscillospiraceae bacterium]
MDECAQQRRQLAKEFLNYRKVFIALGDETRQQIVVALLQNETVGMRVPEITKCTHLSRPAVSHHLQILKDAKLINMHRVGTMNFYYVDADKSCWGGLKNLINHVDAVVTHANAFGYPRLKEDEAP